MIYTYNPDYPVVSHNPADILKLEPPFLGSDLEWSIKDETPHILGVSDGRTTVSVSFASGFPRLLDLISRDPRKWQHVGHNFLRAEHPIYRDRGLIIPADQVEDTIIWHYLVNAHLCKAGGKAVGEGEAGELERRGPGFMNIWTMCSIHTSLPCWKHCREKECVGNPCPRHEPFWYNGLDALGPVIALKDMKRQASILGVDKLYPMHRDLNIQFQKMNEAGVWVNKAYVDEMRIKFLAEKAQMWAKGQEVPNESSLPFNPNSWQQAKKYFKEKYEIKLEDTEEETVRATFLDHPDIPELGDYLAYKELGSGPDRWYADRVWSEKHNDWEGYVRDQGRGLGLLHPNLNHFTSTGRTACSNPNLQNIAKRRLDRKTGENIGQRMRKAIIAPEGYNLYSADYSNGENRAMLYYAGYTIPDSIDLHDWMVANIGITKDDPFAIIMGGPRDAAKSVTHAADYLEGLDLLDSKKLNSPYVQREIRAGARIVFKDWRYKDYVVSFTGSNLAARAYGSRDWDSRKRALGIGERYFASFPKLRDIQKKITTQVAEQGMVRVPHGYVLRSYDRTPGDMLKTAVAMWGSNPIAHYLKLSLLNMANHPNMIPVIPVHDEHVFYVDVRHDPKDVKKWCEECMIFDTPEMPGFKMPIKIKVSTREITGGAPPNWKEMKKIEG